MIIGIIWAIVAGLMLGLYALPNKFTRDFREENTWGLFFMLTMFLVPIVATLAIMKGVGAVYGDPDVRAVLPKMVVTSVLWGIGVMMWGKAIHHIGMSLGFSIFIGTVILVGSLLPFFVDGLPPTNALVAISIGLFFVLLGIVANGRAGMMRERDEASKGARKEPGRKSMAAGITIAVIGGLLATGFSFANAVGRPALHVASLAQGNPEWVTALAVMFPIFLSGGVIMAGYFAWQLSAKKAWGAFRTPAFGRNFLLILIMAFFHYAASAVFAYAAFRLGAVGNTVGYAIFNTSCVVTAIVSGIVVGEWKNASAGARCSLHIGLACMVLGILVISYGNKLAADSAPEATAASGSINPVSQS
ncbi:MAG: rhamnose/proton symporter RhaT [Verrucomicrobia bacterium]|nr:MAG: rhamnose/proton symporter RhaT [Verrucomicrobiota bacterium]